MRWATLAILANIRLGLPGTNALAYSLESWVSRRKSFKTILQGLLFQIWTGQSQTRSPRNPLLELHSRMSSLVQGRIYMSDFARRFRRAMRLKFIGSHWIFLINSIGRPSHLSRSRLAKSLSWNRLCKRPSLVRFKRWNYRVFLCLNRCYIIRFYYSYTKIKIVV